MGDRGDAVKPPSEDAAKMRASRALIGWIK